MQTLQQTNKNIHIHQLEVTDVDNVNQLSRQLKNEPIDILFNNAAVAGEDVPFREVHYDDLLSTLKINTIAPVMVTQAFLPHLSQGKDKLIVNLNSVLGSIELNQDTGWSWIAYRVSKSAFNAATKSMANHLKEKGMIAISLSPGWVRTDMGGQNANLSPEESVQGIRRLLEKISLADSGSFLSYDGKEIPW